MNYREELPEFRGLLFWRHYLAGLPALQVDGEGNFCFRRGMGDELHARQNQNAVTRRQIPAQPAEIDREGRELDRVKRTREASY